MAVRAREAWTDERLDDLQKHMDEGFKEVKGEIREVKAEIKSARTELKDEIRSLSTELKGEIGEVRSGLTQLGNRIDRLSYTIIAGLIGLLATHYLG
jgi:uncharacterized coiled-coil DUF342 family protein